MMETGAAPTDASGAPPPTLPLKIAIIPAVSRTPCAIKAGHHLTGERYARPCRQHEGPEND